MSKNGCVSKDFPLYHSDLISIHEEPEWKVHKHNISQSRYVITNEHPELFRLDGMKEGGYHNPYLNKIIKLDRSLYLNKFSTDRKNINFIDFIKCNPKYSQDPTIIRYISSDRDKELRKKRMGITINVSENSNSKIKNMKSNSYLTEGNIIEANQKYNNMLKQLNHFLPKIDYRIKRTFVPEAKINDIKNDKSDQLYQKIIGKININSNGNLRNLDHFTETDEGSKKNQEFSFRRKKIEEYNPIKDKLVEINPPPYRKSRWSLFLENYYLMNNSAKKFRKRGGLFSEFCNKNIISINNSQKHEEKKELKNINK